MLLAPYALLLFGLALLDRLGLDTDMGPALIATASLILVALTALLSPAYRPAEIYVADQYAGPKSILKPLYDRLLNMGFDIADDVKACPCKTIVPLYRNHVIAQIKPSTRTRIDFGLALGDLKGAGS